MILLRKELDKMFEHIDEAVNWIERQVKFKPKSDLIRMKQAVDLLNNPEKNYSIIHVGGTNGKGSVCAYLTNILVKHKKVGTYTSPYIVKFNERIKVNQRMISDEDLLFEINEIYGFNELYFDTYQERLSFFELITLIALHYFAKQKVEVVVLEVGIGGLLDATNVVQADLAIITSIGLDHIEQLGNTLESIAYNKLGIVKQNTPLITAASKSLYPQFKAHCDKVGVPLYMIDTDQIEIIEYQPLKFIYDYDTYQTGLLGSHQAANAALAITAVHYLYPEISQLTIENGLTTTRFPGRFEILNENPLLILDGAHNESGIEALVTSLKAYYPNRKKHVLFCAMADKDTKRMLTLISDIADSVYLTHFDYKRVLDLDQLLLQTPHENKRAFENPIEAIDYLVKQFKDDVIVITGSLYFVSHVRPYLLKKK
ncbi:MAG: folylpolyglutamate synthase/dihydrofolate synthase family protein [Acholeplasma sp.]|nr:folylpolyglutamate synthase/dihydrofolate synthase family protein [Acholeplasma sp.]